MNSPGQESGAVSFSREQYEALESAVMESARGRWFLAEGKDETTEARQTG